MFGLQVNRTLPVSLTNQLTEQLRDRILKAELKAGERLPATRRLARELNTARNVIIQVYEQLLAEGYLESRAGSGTFVAEVGEYRPSFPPGPGRMGSVDRGSPDKDIIYFHAGNPDSKFFPRLQWAKLYKNVCLDSDRGSFEYGPPQGEWLLRSALSNYLFRVKGIRCLPEQAFIVPGASRGIEMITRVLVDGEGKGAAIEDPSLDYIQLILRHCGVRLSPVPVDQDGIRTDSLPEDDAVKLVYVVPSHQFPMGSVLPIDRRLQLLAYAQDKDAYIVEDDYDSEFRFQGEPIQSLRHLDPDRVVYLGTFSKILSPGLRLGYVILPLHLCARAAENMDQLNFRSSALEQLTLAAFLNERMLEKHIYKLKRIYAAKRSALITALIQEFGSRMVVSGTTAGLHVLVSYCRNFCPEDFQCFKEAGVEADWVEHYALVKGRHRNELVLGYGNLSLEQIALGVKRLNAACKKKG